MDLINGVGLRRFGGTHLLDVFFVLVSEKLLIIFSLFDEIFLLMFLLMFLVLIWVAELGSDGDFVTHRVLVMENRYVVNSRRELKDVEIVSPFGRTKLLSCGTIFSFRDSYGLVE